MVRKIRYVTIQPYLLLVTGFLLTPGICSVLNYPRLHNLVDTRHQVTFLEFYLSQGACGHISIG